MAESWGKLNHKLFWSVCWTLSYPWSKDRVYTKDELDEDELDVTVFIVGSWAWAGDWAYTGNRDD